MPAPCAAATIARPVRHSSYLSHDHCATVARTCSARRGDHDRDRRTQHAPAIAWPGPRFPARGRRDRVRRQTRTAARRPIATACRTRMARRSLRATPPAFRACSARRRRLRAGRLPYAPPASARPRARSAVDPPQARCRRRRHCRPLRARTRRPRRSRTTSIQASRVRAPVRRARGQSPARRQRRRRASCGTRPRRRRCRRSAAPRRRSPGPRPLRRADPRARTRRPPRRATPTSAAARARSRARATPRAPLRVASPTAIDQASRGRARRHVRCRRRAPTVRRACSPAAPTAGRAMSS